jgi:hypothetical protein
VSRVEARLALRALTAIRARVEKDPTPDNIVALARCAGMVEVWAKVYPDLPPMYLRKARGAYQAARLLAEHIATDAVLEAQRENK